MKIRIRDMRKVNFDYGVLRVGDVLQTTRFKILNDAVEFETSAAVCCMLHGLGLTFEVEQRYAKYLKFNIETF